jgi:hypothetical protein
VHARGKNLSLYKVTPSDRVHVSLAPVEVRPVPLTHKVTAGSGFACVIETQKSKHVVAYQVGTAYGQGNSYSMEYTLNPYGVIHARTVNGDWTYQLVLCKTGGGHLWNDWHQYFDGAGEMVASASPLMIGRKWATGVAGGDGIDDDQLHRERRSRLDRRQHDHIQLRHPHRQHRKRAQPAAAQGLQQQMGH